MAIEQLARWWTSASAEERYNLLRATFKGDSEAPPLGALQIAIRLSETEAGEVDG